MVFSSLTFLFFFLPACLSFYYIIPSSFRNSLLLIFSLVFYIWGAGSIVLVLICSIVANYIFGLLIEWASIDERMLLRKVIMFIAIIVNLSILGYYKYANFVAEQILQVVSFLPSISTVNWSPVILPIGISFFTFQSMSYVLDVYHGRTKTMHNPINFAVYVAMFPQLIAGPIVRFHEIAEQIEKRNYSFEQFCSGIVRFVFGLSKKLIIADSVGSVANVIFGLPVEKLSTIAAWVGALAYTVQIYFDFSGYSDMAIGLGQMLGFRFPENFKRPYSAISITDFWRRWHLTLSNWFKDYLYIPLGGSHCGTRRTYFNLFLVFGLVGFWHGASWSFLVWGLYHGFLLVIERLTGQRKVDSGNFIKLRQFFTFVLVMLGWVIFRSETLGVAWGFFTKMFISDNQSIANDVLVILTRYNCIILLSSTLVVLFMPHRLQVGKLVAEQKGMLAGVGRVFLILIVFPYAVSIAASGTFSPFLYFQF